MGAIFKTFDVDDNGTISVEEIKNVLECTDVEKVWSPKVCEDAAKVFVEQFGEDHDGKIDFGEFMNKMRETAKGHQPEGGTKTSPVLDEASHVHGLEGFERAYEI